LVVAALPAGFFDDTRAELHANPTKAKYDVEILHIFTLYSDEWTAFEREVLAEANKLQASEDGVMTNEIQEDESEEDEEYEQLRKDAEEAVIELNGYARLDHLRQQAEKRKRVLAEQLSQQQKKRVAAAIESSDEDEELFDWRTKTLR